MMDRRDFTFAGLLFVLAVFIWMRNRAWMTAAEDTLPVLLALPVFWWLGRPWCFRPGGEGQPDAGVLCTGAFVLVMGVGLNLTVAMALGWTVLLSAWLSARLPAPRWRAVRWLLALPLLSFPWIALEGQPVGWWFRLSGAWAAQAVYALIGLNVEREGTFLLVQGLPMRVDAACAGLNELQSMLIAGTAVACAHIGKYPCFKWSFPLLVCLAWAANTLRVVLLGVTALTVSPEFATGAFHTWGGAAVLCLMFVLCWYLFEWWKKSLESGIRTPGSQGFWYGIGLRLRDFF